MENQSTALLEQFFRLEALFHRYQRIAHTGRPPFTNPLRGQGRVLSILKMKPEISQKELSYLLDMRAQSLGELLAKLEKAGHITRTPSEKDKRVMMIHLTDSGKKAASKTTVDSNGDFNLFRSLTPDEITALSEYLTKIANDLEERLAKETRKKGPASRARHHHHHPFPFGGGFGGMEDWHD